VDSTLQCSTEAKKILEDAFILCLGEAWRELCGGNLPEFFSAITMDYGKKSTIMSYDLSREIIEGQIFSSV
jgi:hypothetical protein